MTPSTAAGIPVLRRIMTHDVTAEGQWYDPDTGEYGPTYPYTDSLITAQRVLGGDRVSRARSDIEDEFAPLPPAPPVAIGDHGELVISTAEEIADALDGHPISRTLPTRAGIVITADVARARRHDQLPHSTTPKPAPNCGPTSPAGCAASRAPKRSPSPPSATACSATASAPASPPTRHSTKPKPTQTPPPRLAAAAADRASRRYPAPADPPRHHRQPPTRRTNPTRRSHRARPAPHHAQGLAGPPFSSGSAGRGAPRATAALATCGGRKSVAPHLLLAVSGVPSMTVRDPVAVNPRPAGSPVLRSAALTPGCRCARAAPAAFFGPMAARPQALRAGLAGPKIRLLLLRRALRG